ncbi:hypothetical protein BP6252_06680 [Coleophoma cylindrospora]|uniref:S-adenosyl-L-methionine-dependent methyltransferase n=1 Tax=Coleophoma cylindrospora TaxID=1849047 RepID=A0A3D8RNK6_9HELO|nr:hypothetical protein BP6252_06680 [Coleophoma cylindrospora]
MVEPTDIIEADDDSFTYEGADLGGESSLLSLTSSVLKGVEENGRTYASYGKEGAVNMERLWTSRRWTGSIWLMRNIAPILANPQKVVDLECGTGIWSIGFADANPSADVTIATWNKLENVNDWHQVTVIDIAPIQLKWTAPNCHFEIDDIEQPWTWREESFDYIFSRDLLLCTRDYPRLIEQCYRYLKPGGYLEFQCIDSSLACDDGTLPNDSPFAEYDPLLRAAATAFRTPLEDPKHYTKWFKAAGFERVTEKIFKMPTSPLPKDPRLRLVGAFEQENLTLNLEGISTRVFRQGLGYGVDKSTVFFASVRKDIKNRRQHSYYPFYVVYGQKPGAL